MTQLRRIRTFWRERLRPWWFDFEWLAVGAFALGVLLLGVWGFSLHFENLDQESDLPDLIFKSLQLFVLETDVDPPMPWQLNLARYLAPLTAAYTAIQALASLFAAQADSLRLRCRRGHVVLCGLGSKGLMLARRFRERGQAVVVIEKDAGNSHLALCRDQGGIVLIGDATEPWLLQKAGVARARHLFALCGDDGVNAEIAVRVAPLLGGRTGPPLTCVVHVFDPQLCILLREHELDGDASLRLRLEFFNVYDLGARVLLEQYPLLAPGHGAARTDAHLVIVGIGRLGESLVVTAARQWHTDARPPGTRLRVTLIDQRATERTATLVARYPALESTCDLTPLDMAVESNAFQRANFLAHPDATNLAARVFVCLDDDSLGLETALSLLRHHESFPSTIIVRMAQDAGLGALLRGVAGRSGAFHQLRAFGLLDRTCHPEQILRGTHETLARAIHDEYLRQQTAAGVSPQQNRSMVPWDALPEHLKESNRQQADDLGAKLHAVHCALAPLLDWDEPLPEFTPAEIERLARMEHDRWMQAKLDDGWQYGPHRDDNAKSHPCLVSFDQLPPDEQDKDRHTAHQIPATLAKAGFRVRRLRPPQETPSTPHPAP